MYATHFTIWDEESFVHPLCGAKTGNWNLPTLSHNWRKVTCQRCKKMRKEHERAKNLNEIFSKDEVTQIVEYACGHKLIKKELKETELQTTNIKEFGKMTDTQKALYCMENTLQQLVVPIYGIVNKRKMVCSEVAIHSNGSVVCRNMGGCSFRLHQPLEVYEIVLKKRDKLKKLREALSYQKS